MAKKDKHTDGSAEAGELSAEAMMDAVHSAPTAREVAVPASATTTTTTTTATTTNYSAPIRGGKCPLEDPRMADKTPSVFEWHCLNSPLDSAIFKYAGRKFLGRIMTEIDIRRVAEGGLAAL